MTLLGRRILVALAVLAIALLVYLAYPFASALLVAAVLAAIFYVSAGDLNPPPGLITATQRTPIGPSTTPGDVDSLYKITQPGSYYLTGNISGVANKIGIEIASSGVTLDLMGFDLEGVLGSFSGVSVTIAVTDIAVFNGSVRNWGNYGVILSTASATHLANLRVSGNAISGIVAGGNAVVTGCSARNNSDVGISVASAGTITNCSASLNGGDGFSLNLGSLITNCSAVSNTGDGISVGQACVVRENVCQTNGFGGGTGAGIRATSINSRIEDNNCTLNDVGVEADSAGNLIIKNSCASNTTNYDFVLGNRYGPIINLTAGGAAAVSGNSAVSAVASTDPWANFAY